MSLVSQSASLPRGCARGPWEPGANLSQTPHCREAASPLCYVRFSSLSQRGPLPSLQPLATPVGGCEVPPARLSGRQPPRADACLTCLTRAVPVASLPCGLCVGRGWGPGLARSGWTAGAWSWNRPPATGDCQAGTGWHQRGWSPPQAELWPTEPESLRLPDRGPGGRGLCGGDQRPSS